MTTLASDSCDPQVSNLTESILVIEAPPSPLRQRWIQDRIHEIAQPIGRTFMLCGDFDSGGPWAGVNEFFLSLLPEIQSRRRDLIDHHAFELVQVIPGLRHSLTVNNPTLTDLASDDEKVRNYAADRTFRIVQGLIDLVDSWKSMMEAEVPWIIACDSYDAAGPVSQRFFRELMRRRGQQLRLRLLVGISPDNGTQVCSLLAAASSIATVEVRLTELPQAVIAAKDAGQKGDEIEQQVGIDRIQRVIHLPEAIKLWKAAGRPEMLLRWKYFGMAFYLNLGYYAEALRYGDGLLEMVAKHRPNSIDLQWWIITKMLIAFTALGDAEAGLRLAEGEGLRLAPRVVPEWQAQLYYLTAMLFARYQRPRNFAKGEEYLDRGLEIIQQANIPAAERAFLEVFNRNGVAMIRSFEGRHKEAMDLCRLGIEKLNTHLSPEKHKLHRSILHYNIAQVYVATASYPEAIQYHSAAIAMDPNYSEYYNERGSIFLRLGQLAEARADYLRAIELSPPYFEVFTNLGQCYRRMGATAEAIASYTRALDLEPSQPLALAGRGKVHDELGHVMEAIADYSASLALDGTQWEVLASRAVMYYQVGDLQSSLADLDRAIELSPSNPDLYQNRATVLGDLGRNHAATKDLEIVLRLNSAEQAATL